MIACKVSASFVFHDFLCLRFEVLIQIMTRVYASYLVQFLKTKCFWKKSDIKEHSALNFQPRSKNANISIPFFITDFHRDQQSKRDAH